MFLYADVPAMTFTVYPRIGWTVPGIPAVPYMCNDATLNEGTVPGTSTVPLQ